MHAAELVELAAMLVASAPALLTAEAHVPRTSLERYWTASKCRLDRWQRAIGDYRDFADSARRRATANEWRRIRVVVEEIVTGEMLTRVWAALLTAGDQLRKTDYGEPIARSVLIGHMEARNRTLSLVVLGHGVDPDQAIAINRLRRRVERWTDLLVGHLVAIHDVSQFAPNPDRARDFADDLRGQRTAAAGRFAWPLTLTAIRAGLSRGNSEPSPNADLNSRIASAILSSLSPLAFDATGVVRSLWLIRMTTVADETQGMIEDLLAQEAPGRPGNRGQGIGDRD